MIDFLPLLAQFESEEYQAGTLILICFLPAALSIAAFFFFMRGELRGWTKTLKWIALVPLIVGAILGIGPMTAMADDLYRTNYGAGPRAQMLHYGGVAIPVLVAIALVIAGLLHDRQRVDEL